MGANEMTPFLFEGENLVRIVMQDEQPWFVAADVCRVLGIQQPSRAVENLAEDEKGVSVAHTPGGMQEMIIISESGLYALIFRSRKPAAQRFRKWVTSDVLPAIRKTGSYVPGSIGTDGQPKALREWPLDEMRTKKSVVDMYRLTDGIEAARWIMAEIGFPPTPPHLISRDRQGDLFSGYSPDGFERPTEH